MKRATLRALVAPVAAAIVSMAAAPAGAATSVTITQPAPGSSVSRSTTPHLTVAGGVSFATPKQASRTFYLRRDGCGSSNDNPHLSVTKGTDKGDGCGFVLGTVGIIPLVDGSLSVDFPTQDGIPLTYDGSRNVTGVIAVGDVTGGAANGGGGDAGQMTVSLVLQALVQGNGYTVGTDAETVTVTPQQAIYAVPFTIKPTSDALANVDKQDVSGLDLNVKVSGPYVGMGYLALSGKSYMSVPMWTASFTRAVQVSLDGSSFASPTTATLSSTLTGWKTTIATPAVGKHTIYVRSRQGFGYSPVVSTTFTVTS